MNIYNILISKPHNKHYLNRYWKFIKSIHTQQNSQECTENHHICPKAKDLFPEYKSLTNNPWNSIHLTRRQHWIAHWMLSKSYGKSQSTAFFRMCAKTDKRITSRTYEIVKAEHSIIMSIKYKGTAIYVGSDGNNIRCCTSDDRVLSGEFVSTSKGRRYPSRSDSSRKKIAYIHAMRSEEDIKKIIDKIKKTKSLKTEDEVKATRQKMSDGCMNRTPEERLLSQQKRNATNSAKSEEVKKQETLKRVSTYKETVRLKKLNSIN